MRGCETIILFITIKHVFEDHMGRNRNPKYHGSSKKKKSQNIIIKNISDNVLVAKHPCG